MAERRASSLGVIMAVAMVVIMAVLGLGLVAAEEDPWPDAPRYKEDPVLVEALVAIRAALRDPNGVLVDWVANSSVHPCNWTGVVCSVSLGIDLHSRNLSGTLSPEIGKIRWLEDVNLGDNDISGPIPETLGEFQSLVRVDLSNNRFSGTIPPALCKEPIYDLQLSHNNLSGTIPDAIFTHRSNFFVDLSFNNLSGTLPDYNISFYGINTANFEGNPILHYNCNGTCGSTPMQENALPKESPTHWWYIIAMSDMLTYLVISFLIAFFLVMVLVVFWQWHRRHQIFADIYDKNESEACFGHLKRYMLKEIKQATNNFNRNNILGQGGFGIVYKGLLHDGTIAAVKRLKDFVSSTGEHQFRTEVAVISLVVHRNLLSLIGFCSEKNERLLVYPYMPNGTVSSKLQEYVNQKPALDWPTRKKIALGTARGLVYLHDQCYPKIIHRDIKASNVLLDEEFEAIVADFGMAKMLEQGQTHVISEIRGTFGRIAPEYLRTGESSEKTDVYAYGLLLMELITGRRTLDVREEEYPKGGLVDWARELLEEGQLSSLVDKRLGSDYDSAELVEMVQTVLLCAMYNADHRPRMSEVVRMLEGDGSSAKRWEALKDIPTTPLPGTPVFIPSLAHGGEGEEYQSGDIEAIELSGPR
ncbi:protein NSP-INTERACTING KINASE 3 [Brachypodium distachyon]|uniref:protein NSP-INTERACTING KINASE 3 n=1 Tax=Brachypodium distachyon TaxID=15368 RepID=UPI000D0DC938|nr:protein NSP-INTERACTING KINASE 3 [Brachypodium distachyon]|eukprot:XP_014754077.2 protein NSP-INTERACTING KINASE 3 [Brachypodium distachyon]